MQTNRKIVIISKVNTIIWISDLKLLPNNIKRRTLQQLLQNIFSNSKETYCMHHATVHLRSALIVLTVQSFNVENARMHI